MYRPSKRPPRGAWARHLQEQRRLRDLSAVEAFELVYERIGWSRKSRTAYVAIDSGDRQPKDNEVTVLGAEFGWPTAEDADPEPADSAAYLARIDALVEQLAEDRAVIRSLIALLRGTPQGPGPEPLIELATREVEAVDEAAGKPRPQTTSRPRRSARGRPSAERRRESREGETA